MSADRLPPNLQGLLQAEAYRHPVGRIELVETHISWILLTGTFAYKLKKPVRNEFIDYGTLDKRRYFCEQELRLNRRFAPELYVELAAIVNRPDGLHVLKCDVRPAVSGIGEHSAFGAADDSLMESLNGDPIIEWAVVMRQFPRDALLATRLSQNLVSAEQIQRLARSIAQFHCAAEQLPAGLAWGTAAQVVERAEQNLLILQQLMPADTLPRIASLVRWTKEQSARLSGQFSARRAAGFVRACHGDLHLGNLLWWGNRPMLFDGIEFNESLRWIDVQSDLAFLWMDLYEHQRADLAGILLNTYLEETGDYQGVACLQWYAVYRALVRAKVAALREQQSSPDPAAARRDHQVVEEYLNFATELTAPKTGGVVLTTGPSGSGKTFGTTPLLSTGRAIRIRSDIERRRLEIAGQAPGGPTDRPAETLRRYSLDQRQRVYEHLAESARQIATAGFWVIVDATFLKRSQRDRFYRLAAELILPCYVLEFTAPVEVLEARIRERLTEARDASEANVTVLREQLETMEPLSEEERSRCVSVENARDWLR